MLKKEVHKMLTQQELMIAKHCEEIELDSREIATIIYLFREKTPEIQEEIMEDMTRMNTWKEMVDLFL